MRLLKTHSHTSKRQGYEADKELLKKERKEGLAVRDRNKSSTSLYWLAVATCSILVRN